MARATAEEIGASKNYWQQLRDYFAEVRSEMKRVTWPGKQEIYGTTLMVILTTFLFGFYFAICDWAFRHLVGRVLQTFLHTP
jgi:preprotein translocase subunit SecE